MMIPSKLLLQIYLPRTISVNRCMIHRQTLAELYMILKEEADVFEECLENAEQSGFKRYRFISIAENINFYQCVIVELKKEVGLTIVLYTEKLLPSCLRL